MFVLKCHMSQITFLTFCHNNEIFKQHKSKMRSFTDRCRVLTEPLTQLVGSSSLWSLFDCLRTSSRSQALQISIVAISGTPDSAGFVFESSSWWVKCTKTIRRQQALQSKETKEVLRSKKDFTLSRKARFLWSYYSQVALLELFLHLLCISNAHDRDDGGRIMFAPCANWTLCPALTSTCLQLLTSHFIRW